MSARLTVSCAPLTMRVWVRVAVWVALVGSLVVAELSGFSVAQRQATVGDLVGSGSPCYSLAFAQTQCLAQSDCTSVVSVNRGGCIGPGWMGSNGVCLQDCTLDSQSRDPQGRCYCNSDAECTYDFGTGLKCSNGVCGGLMATMGPICFRASTAPEAQRADSWDASTGVPSLWIRTSALEDKTFRVDSLRDMGGLKWPTCDTHHYLMPHSATCKPCEPGSSCEAGHCVYSCTPCAAGTYASGQASACTPCPSGTYAPDAGSTSCQTCSAPKKTNSEIGAFYCAVRQTLELHGARGPLGPRGVTGPQGPAGPAGLPGPEGSRGPRGYPGSDGLDGDQGNRGPMGPSAAYGGSTPSGVYTTTGVHGMFIWLTTLGTLAAGTLSLRASYRVARSRQRVVHYKSL